MSESENVPQLTIATLLLIERLTFQVSLLQFIDTLTDTRSHERCIPLPVVFICCNQADRVMFVPEFLLYMTPLTGEVQHCYTPEASVNA